MSDADSTRLREALEKLNHNKLLRILTPLVHRRATLSRENDPDGSFRYSTGSGGMKLDATIARDDVAALLARDLIEKAAGGYRISAAGRAFVKRAFAAGDAFHAQHAARRPGILKNENGEQAVIVNDAESPLAWLARRRDKSGTPLIAPCQFAAGERLRADYTYAALTPRTTASYSGTARSSSGHGNDAAHISDTVLAARQRVARALAAVGPELAGVLVDVCCHLKGLEEAERNEGWPQRSGKVVLQLALTRLARHYGLIGDAGTSGSLRRRLQHWGAADYRPSVDGDEPPQETAEAS